MNGGALVGVAWIVGIVGLYQTVIAILAATFAVRHADGVAPYDVGRSLGEVIGSMMIVAFAVWLHRKGWAKVRANKENLLALPQHSPAQKRWHWQLIVGFVIFLIATNLTIRWLK